MNRTRLAKPQVEPIIEPSRRIVDAHHHLYDRPGTRYLLDEFVADLNTGHDICATVFVQARHAYDKAVAEPLRPVGETVFARHVRETAALGDAARLDIAAAIIPFADLMLGDAVAPVLDAHVRAGGGRVRGIRHILAWDCDGTRLNPAYPTTEGMMDSTAFRAGFQHLASRGLSFDAWVLFPQLSRLARLAQDFPETMIVLDHCGGPLLGGYGGGENAVFAAWRRDMRAVAACPNVSVKLSGLGMPSAGFGRRSTSTELADAWRPWMETCIELFGPARAMFASNFPADRPGHDYAMGWNAMKRVADGSGEAEKDLLFRGSAARFYRLSPDGADKWKDG